MSTRFILSTAFISIALLSTACAPKVYVIDRATILEEESGGEWPQVDAAIRQKLLKTSPSAMKTTESSDRQNKLTRTLEPDESTVPGVKAKE